MPYPNNWAARQKDPSQYSSFATKKDQGGKGIDFVIGFKKGGGSEVQSIHFSKDVFPSKQKVITWLKKHQFATSVESNVSEVNLIEEAQMISFEKIRQLLQEAVDQKYPLVTDPNSGEDPYDWCHRFSVMKVFDTEAILRRGWEYIDEENDPTYMLIDYNIDKGNNTVKLGEEEIPLELRFTSSDGKRIINMDESENSIFNNIIEAGKRNSSTDNATINKILQLVMDLVKKEDLEDETVSSMKDMTASDAKKPINTKEEITQEAWDGSKSRFSIDQLVKSVPRAIATWAKKKAGTGNNPIKSDLHLPYKEPDGTPNADGIRNALARLPQVKGVPSDVMAAAKKELEAALKKANGGSAKESEETNEKDVLVEWDKLDGETFEETFVCSMDEASYDEATGVVKNVDILGSVSKNNRRYSETVQKEAAPLFEGAKAYLNHQPGNQMKEARRVEDMIGQYKNIHVKDGKTKGDLHLIKDKKVVTEHVMPVVKDAPHLVGNSIVARGQMSKGSDGVYDVEKIIGVRSVDMVSEPATTDGLFSESITEDKMADTKAVELKDITLAQLKEGRPDLFEAYLADKTEKERVQKLENDLKEAQANLVTKDQKIVELESKEQKREKTQKIATIIHEAKVPDSFRYEKDTKNIKSHLVSILERCANDEEMTGIVKDWEQPFEEMVKEANKQKKFPVSIEKKATDGTNGELKESDLTQLYRAFVS